MKQGLQGCGRYAGLKSCAQVGKICSISSWASGTLTDVTLRDKKL